MNAKLSSMTAERLERLLSGLEPETEYNLWADDLGALSVLAVGEQPSRPAVRLVSVYGAQVPQVRTLQEAALYLLRMRLRTVVSLRLT